MQRAFDFCDELFRAASQDERARFGGWAAGEEVIPLGADLDLFKFGACAKMIWLNITTCGLNGGARGGAYSVEV